MVVDDDADLRTAISASLRGAGISVDTAADLREAERAFAVTSYDCVVLDLSLPGGDTFAYGGERRVPVLFLTARELATDRLAAPRPAGDLLVKPFAMAELVARVGVLGRATAVSVMATPDLGSLVVLEGHARMTAIFVGGHQRRLTVRAYPGLSPAIERWGCF